MKAPKNNGSMSAGRHASNRASSQRGSPNEHLSRFIGNGSRRGCGKISKKTQSDSERKRNSLACARCRKRKIRCSGHHLDDNPCDACKAAGTEVASECVFIRVNAQELQDLDVKSRSLHKEAFLPSAETPDTFPLESSHRILDKHASQYCFEERRPSLVSRNTTNFNNQDHTTSLDPSLLAASLTSFESLEGFETWNMASSLPPLPNHDATNLQYVMAYTEPAITVHPNFEMSPNFPRIDSKPLPERPISTTGTNYQTDASCDRLESMQNGLYGTKLGIDGGANLCPSHYQPMTPQSCAIDPSGSVQSLMPTWRTAPTDRTYLREDASSTIGRLPSTPSTSYGSLPISSAPSPASIQSSRRHSMQPTSVMPKQHLTIGYNMNDQDSAMGETFSMSSYIPEQSLHAFAQGYGAAQQAAHRRRSLDDHVPQQQPWDYDLCAQGTYNAYARDLQFMTPSPCMSFCL